MNPQVQKGDLLRRDPGMKTSTKGIERVKDTDIGSQYIIPIHVLWTIEISENSRPECLYSKSSSTNVFIRINSIHVQVVYKVS